MSDREQTHYYGDGCVEHPEPPSEPDHELPAAPLYRCEGCGRTDIAEDERGRGEYNNGHVIPGEMNDLCGPLAIPYEAASDTAPAGTEGITNAEALLYKAIETKVLAALNAIAAEPPAPAATERVEYRVMYRNILGDPVQYGDGVITADDASAVIQRMHTIVSGGLDRWIERRPVTEGAWERVEADDE